jgi:hypothetical protein
MFSVPVRGQNETMQAKVKDEWRYRTYKERMPAYPSFESHYGIPIKNFTYPI